jgi:hypothetical protein
MMKRTGFMAVAFMAALAIAAGCGKGTKNQEQGKEAFRVPDSLVAPIEGFHLTVDEYHVVRGGVMANAQMELHYPASDIARFVAVKTFGFAKAGYEKATTEIGRPAEGKLVLIGATDLPEYLTMTRKEWWYYGYIKGDTIIFEPFDIMIKRFIAEPGITNRIVQVAVNRRSGGRCPSWLKEAIATRAADEVEILKVQMPEFEHAGNNMNPSPDDIDRSIAAGTDRGNSRVAYYAAYRMLDKLLAKHTMDNVRTFLDRLREGKSLDEASKDAFGMTYTALLDKIRVDR